MFNSTKQKELLRKYHYPNLLKVKNNLTNKNIVVTGRTANCYLKQLFPDGWYEFMGHKAILDIGCGLNPIYPKSFINRINGIGLDIFSPKYIGNPSNYIQGSIYKTGFPDNTFDLILCHYLLYFWIDKPDLLKKAFRELYRILKSKGEIRIFPIYFANYSLSDIKFFAFMNNMFKIRLVKPKVYSKDGSMYYEKGKFIKTKSDSDEANLNKKLMSYTLILSKN